VEAAEALLVVFVVEPLVAFAVVLSAEFVAALSASALSATVAVALLSPLTLSPLTLSPLTLSPLTLSASVLSVSELSATVAALSVASAVALLAAFAAVLSVAFVAALSVGLVAATVAVLLAFLYFTSFLTIFILQSLYQFYPNHLRTTWPPQSLRPWECRGSGWSQGRCRRYSFHSNVYPTRTARSPRFLFMIPFRADLFAFPPTADGRASYTYIFSFTF
jgi:hypothetical protein